MRPQRRIHPVLLVLIGIAAAAVGLLPWLVTGLRLPLQNLWADDTAPADMPIALLPYSQYLLSLLVAVIVVGSGVAGLVARATRSRPWFLVGGVLLVQGVATVQAAVTVSGGLRDGAEAEFYLGALVGGTIAAIVLGVLVLLLIALAPVPGAVIGISIAAVALGSWLSGLFFPINVISSASPLTAVLSETARFVPAVVIGVAIAWAGLRTVGRSIAAFVALALLWVGPALVTAVSAAVGSRVLARYPAEMLEYGSQVFGSAVGMPELFGPPLAVAVVVAVVGLVVRSRLSRPGEAPPPAPSYGGGDGTERGPYG